MEAVNNKNIANKPSQDQGRQARPMTPPAKKDDSKTQVQTKNHGPTKNSGRATDTPDGTIEQVPEEQAP